MRKRIGFELLYLMVQALLVLSIQADTRILILGWNLESGDNDPHYIADQLEALEGYDLFGLTEVNAGNAQTYAEAVEWGEGAYGRESKFEYRVSDSGSGDRMMIVWDAARFDLIEIEELTQTSDGTNTYTLNDGNHRSPFVAEFHLQGTSTRFLFMVNHLARVNANLRQEQATGLTVWAQQQTLPILAAGDYNFDYNIDNGRGNAAFHNFVAPGVFDWVQPGRLEKTSLHPRYNGILDFFFVAHQPSHWQVDSKILFDGFTPPDDASKSDHRPVEGKVLIQN